MTSTTLSFDDAHAQAAAFIEARRALHGDARMDATAGGTDGGNDDESDGGNDGGSDDTKTPEEKLAELTAALEESKKNSRKHEDRAKANKAAADELARIKAAGATDADKATAAEERAARAETELARYKVALTKSLPAELAALLNGTEDEMSDQADALLKFRGEQPKPKPKPDPSQGGSGDPAKKDQAELGRAEAQRRIASRTKKP